MSELTFYIVDVFAESKYAGNQLAVVRAAGSLPDETMQQIAREMNFSETTFILADDERDGGYDVRIFTPGEELPFAGHPTLGTAYVLQREIVGISFEQITLNLKVGPIPVTFTYKDGLPDVLWMRHRPPQFGAVVEREAAAQALGLAAADLDERFPPQVVSTGVPFLIVPITTLEAVRRAQAQIETYRALTEQAGARWILFFCGQTYEPENQINARMIFEAAPGSFREDPATGAANGCLAAYLSHHRYLGSASVNARVEQGYEIQRPSLLLLRTEQGDDGMQVSVGGRVIKVAEGRLV